MDKQTLAKVTAALDAADIMYAEFMDATCSISEQVAIYKAAHTKVKAARKAIGKVTA
jgi:hypothetical protein